MFEDLFTKLKRFYGNIYTKYAIFVSKNYLLFICIPFFINLILSFGILKVNFIKDPNDLFTFVDSQAKTNEMKIRKLFDYNRISKENNKFLIHQILDQGLFAEINFHGSNISIGDNVMNKIYINDIIKINQIVQENISIFSSELDINLTYKDLCAKSQKICSVEGETLIFDENLYKCKIINSDDETTDDTKFHMDAETFKVTALKYNLGSGFRYVFSNDTKCLEAKFLKLRYALNDFQSEKNVNNIDYYRLSKKWELEFVKFMNQLDMSKYNVSVTYSVSQSLETELTKTMLADLYFVISSVFSMILLGFLVLIFNSRQIFLRSIILPCCSIACAFGALTSTIGLLSFFGYQMCEFVFLDLFILIGN